MQVTKVNKKEQLAVTVLLFNWVMQSHCNSQFGALSGGLHCFSAVVLVPLPFPTLYFPMNTQLASVMGAWMPSMHMVAHGWVAGIASHGNGLGASWLHEFMNAIL